MQALASVAKPFGQLLLDEGVDVLGVRVYGKSAAVYVLAYLLKLRAYLFALLGAYNALPPQHGSVGDAALYVLPVHAAVKGYAGVEIVGPGVGLLFEPPFPELHFTASTVRKSRASLPGCPVKARNASS